MIESTWQPNGLEVSPRVPYNAPKQMVGASAQGSEDGKTVTSAACVVPLAAADHIHPLRH